MTLDPSHKSPGPFHPEQLRSGDRYELSNGHPIYCPPADKDGTGPNGLGFAVLSSDPMVQSAGVDPGIDLGGQTLRAPDVGVGLREGPGIWFKGVALALEYAGTGHDERDLRTKITELLEGGTRWVWVARLTGPQRVEVHAKGATLRVAGIDEELTAPGVLELPVPVRALFDRDAAKATELRNLLKKQGYDGLDGVRREAAQLSSERRREEGREEGSLAGRREALLEVLAERGLGLDPEQSALVAACRDRALLARWLKRALVAASSSEVFA